MAYKIKKGFDSFEVVDGIFAGKKYERDKVYDDIPPNEKHKFEEVAAKADGAGVRPTVPDKAVSAAPDKKPVVNIETRRGFTQTDEEVA